MRQVHLTYSDEDGVDVLRLSYESFYYNPEASFRVESQVVQLSETGRALYDTPAINPLAMEILIAVAKAGLEIGKRLPK